MKQLHMMVGLPRSGKSTTASEMGYPVVSCDAIRQSLGVYPFVPAAEPWVWRIARTMVESLFNAGHDHVVLDTCAHTRKRREEWRSPKWTRIFTIVPTPADVCIERSVLTNQEYLILVIEKMAEEYEPVEGDEEDLDDQQRPIAEAAEG